MVRSQLGQIVCKTLSQKNPSQKNRAPGMAQNVIPEFKPEHYKKKYFLDIIVTDTPQYIRIQTILSYFFNSDCTLLYNLSFSI
jgi:hypothetical protein